MTITWTPEMVETIKKMRKDRKHWDVIAERVGVGLVTLKKFAKKEGLAGQLSVVPPPTANACHKRKSTWKLEARKAGVEKQLLRLYSYDQLVLMKFSKELIQRLRSEAEFEQNFESQKVAHLPSASGVTVL